MNLGERQTPPHADIVQTIVIPEVVDLVYTGDLQFEIDPCEEEVTIEASVEGGQPFVSPNGDTFYQYKWILTTTDNEIFNYSGKSDNCSRCWKS